MKVYDPDTEETTEVSTTWPDDVKVSERTANVTLETGESVIIQLPNKGILWVLAPSWDSEHVFISAYENAQSTPVLMYTFDNKVDKCPE